MEFEAFTIVALFMLGFGVVSGKLQQSIVTPPMVFTLVGMLLYVMGLVELKADDPLVKSLAEITLVVVLFTDASRIHLRLLRRGYMLSLRMLSIGMPLTIALGTFITARMFGGLEFWEAALLAAVLTPTDAALGQAVISSEAVPLRIRQTLNVESGLNDGIALPVITLFLSFAALAENQQSTAYWATFIAGQIILGPLVGIVVGYLGGRLIKAGMDHLYINESFQRISGLALALLAFSAAEVVGGNGFIAAFMAGLMVGNTARKVCHPMYDFAEAEGQLLTLLMFLVFGLVMVFPALEVLNWTIVLYAALSLTIVRMIPVSLSLLGTNLRPATHLFLGWFGPRGVASILFGLLVVEQSALVGRDEIFNVMVIVVLISIFVHGFSAAPAAEAYGAHAHTHPRHVPEHHPVHAMPLRIR